jgi:NADH:ubiquinone oxidoreductase subunit 4 (subunit M)
MEIPWVLVSVAVLAVMIAVIGVMLMKKKNWKREVDYRSYFSMGVVWLPIGIVFSIILNGSVGLFFLIMGLAYMAVGLKNRDKWGKPQKLSPKSQRAMMLALFAGVILLALGIVVFELLNAVA